MPSLSNSKTWLPCLPQYGTVSDNLERLLNVFLEIFWCVWHSNQCVYWLDLFLIASKKQKPWESYIIKV